MNFWRYSIERLYALAEWHSVNPDQKLLHLESDIFIMPNFPIEKLEMVNHISWCSFNNSHDVASLVFSPSNSDTSWMLNELEEILIENSSLTDMTGLRKLKEKFPDKAGYLNTGEAISFLGGVCPDLLLITPDFLAVGSTFFFAGMLSCFIFFTTFRFST
jgi:hypothetical protein